MADKQDGPVTSAEEARQLVAEQYGLGQASSDIPDPTPPPPPPPLPTPPEAGTADVRIKPGFPVHFFVIPSLGDLQLSQDWTNVPQAQLAEIMQLAAVNQVLLEVDEAAS